MIILVFVVRYQIMTLNHLYMSVKVFMTKIKIHYKKDLFGRFM